MSETWSRVRRRHDLLGHVLDEVDRAGLAGLAVWDADLKEEYGEDGLGGLLADVQRRWQRSFDARLDAVLEGQPADLRTAAATLWRTMGREQPAARLLLDAHADHPALAAPLARHRRMLHATTGVRPSDLERAPSDAPHTHGDSHDRQRRARQRAVLRLRPLCRRVRRQPVPGV